jgi:hypothetical protein
VVPVVGARREVVEAHAAAARERVVSGDGGVAPLDAQQSRAQPRIAGRAAQQAHVDEAVGKTCGRGAGLDEEQRRAAVEQYRRRPADHAAGRAGRAGYVMRSAHVDAGGAGRRHGHLLRSGAVGPMLCSGGPWGSPGVPRPPPSVVHVWTVPGPGTALRTGPGVAVEPPRRGRAPSRRGRAPSRPGHVFAPCRPVIGSLRRFRGTSPSSRRAPGVAPGEVLLIRQAGRTPTSGARSPCAR